MLDHTVMTLDCYQFILRFRDIQNLHKRNTQQASVIVSVGKYFFMHCQHYWNWDILASLETSLTVDRICLSSKHPLYRKTSSISCTKSQNINVSCIPCSCLRSIHWSQVLSWEWRCSWSSADRGCSNYIWVINNFIAYWGAAYIIGFMVD